MYKLLRKAMYHSAAFLFAVVVAIAFISVLFRYVLNNSITWSEEIMRYIFIWMFFLALGNVTRTGSHISLDLLVSRLKGKAKKTVEIIIEFLSFCFVLVMVYYGIKLTGINMSQSTSALRIPYGIIFAAIPFGGIMMGIFNIVRIFDIISGKVREES